MHPSQHSSTIGVLSTADDGDHNLEDNIEHREEENEKTTDNNDSRRDYRVRHCCVDGHRELKCLREGTNFKMRLKASGDTHKPIESPKRDG